MFKTRSILASCVLSLAFGTASLVSAADKTYQSHAPVRPLPTASTRPLAEGVMLYVDAAKGDDSANGSMKAPWKTINASLAKLKPGNTLVLRGGTYYESVTIRNAGTKEQPITIRSYPNELVIVDAGYPDFQTDPAHAWEPVTDGAPGEYQSTKTYTEFGGNGRFVDSMLPFQRYISMADLRTDNELMLKELGNRNVDTASGCYAGPGVRRDEQGKIHIRLAHTKLEGLGDDAYTGETDPRKMPIVISGADYGLAIQGGQNIRLQDLVIRGGHRTALRMEKAADVECDGLTLYAGDAAMAVSQTTNMKITNSALRGFSSPWLSRFHEKDRSKSGYLMILGGENFEVANCELTDHHDGVQMHQVVGLKFHHNYCDNFNDDGIEPGIKQAKGAYYLYCNYFTRMLSPFTAHGNPIPVAGEPGSGMWVFRNVVDLREGSYYAPPDKQDPTGAFKQKPIDGMLHDHKSPIQPNYYVYQNTFIMNGPSWRNVYAFSWGNRTTETTRRVFNNICFQVDGVPGALYLVKPEDDFQSDGNLAWSLKEGPNLKGDIYARFRESALFKSSKTKYAAGWGANDVVGDPKFTDFKEDYRQGSDLRLQQGSAAIDAGQPLPSAWPDPIRDGDAGKPDIGAFPAGIEPWKIGVNGRMSAFGKLIEPK